MIRTNLFSILLARFQETLDLPLGVSHLQVHNQYLVCVCVYVLKCVPPCGFVVVMFKILGLEVHLAAIT